eukprot:COSAG01_NODE_26050_length_725_cov_0.701278_1_plen_58_part_00
MTTFHYSPACLPPCSLNASVLRAQLHSLLGAARQLPGGGGWLGQWPDPRQLLLLGGH